MNKTTPSTHRNIEMAAVTLQRMWSCYINIQHKYSSKIHIISYILESIHHLPRVAVISSNIILGLDIISGGEQDSIGSSSLVSLESHLLNNKYMKLRKKRLERRELQP